MGPKDTVSVLVTRLLIWVKGKAGKRESIVCTTVFCLFQKRLQLL